MSQAAPAITRSPAEVVRLTPVSQAPNGICYAVAGEVAVNSFDLERMIAAVPTKIAHALERKAYYFVPLTVSQGEETVIADRYDVALSDNAVCHRNLNLGDSQCVFISTRLMDDKFSVAFEFYINVGHALVERAGVSRDFSDLAWAQVEAGHSRRNFARRLGGPQARHRPWPRRRALQERISRRNFFRHDFHLPAVALSRRGLLRLARTRLSAARALRAGRAPAQGGRVVPAELRIRVRHPLQAPRITGCRFTEQRRSLRIPHPRLVLRIGTEFQSASPFLRSSERC